MGGFSDLMRLFGHGTPSMTPQGLDGGYPNGHGGPAMPPGFNAFPPAQGGPQQGGAMQQFGGGFGGGFPPAYGGPMQAGGFPGAYGGPMQGNPFNGGGYDNFSLLNQLYRGSNGFGNGGY